MSLEELNNQSGQEDNQPADLGGQEPNQSLLGGDQNPPVEQDTPAATTAPDSIDDYEVNVDGFDFDEFKSFDANKEFLERAREAGLDNSSLGFLLGEYNQLIPAIMGENAALDNEACVAAMTEQWGNDTQQNFGFAKAAASNAIQNGILTAEEVNSPEFGNNPLVLKMAAYFGQQLGEDVPPRNTQQSDSSSIEELMRSEAFSNASHPDHKKVAGQVNAFYAKQFPEG